MKIKIGIANYGIFYHYIEKVREKLPEEVELVILDGLFTELEETVRKMEANQQVDVFVASGSSANFLEKYLKNTPMVRIKVTGFDLLHTLQEVKSYSDHAAIISHITPIACLDDFDSILNINVEEIVYEKQEELDVILKCLAAKGIRDVIGTAYVLDRAHIYGMRGYLIWSQNSIQEAIETAIDLVKRMKYTIEQARKLDYILDYSSEGILLTDQNGVITDFNTSAERILHRSKKNVIGKFCWDVLPNTQLDVVLKEKRPQYNKIQDLGNVKIVTNRSPIISEGETIGALATFFNVNTIEKAGASIRQSRIHVEYNAKNYFDELIGQSDAYQQMKRDAEKFARSDLPVLLCGESGTGKEVIAQCIHNASPRKNERFVVLNSSSFSTSLLERELFGYEENVNGKKGYLGIFEKAQHGTLFINEVSDLPLRMQARILKVIEEKEVLRIGGAGFVPINVRIIAATNQDLQQMIIDNNFRKDLYYLLDVLRINVPPLRNRKEDIPLFISRFLSTSTQDMTLSEIRMISELQIFQDYDWPGNIRELRNIIERFAISYCPGDDINKLALRILGLATEEKGQNEKVSNEKDYILSILEQTNGNREKAAEILGISRTTLWRKLRETDKKL